jgi:hypothetical protein
MKIPGPLGAITVYGNQQTARNIERDFVLGQRNVHCLMAQREVPASASPTDKEYKAQLQSNDGTKTVPLDQATPKQTVTIGEDLTSHDEEKLLCCLSKNKDVFAWSALDLVGVSRSIIEHSLGIDPSVRPKKQRLRKMSDEKTEAAKAEVHRLMEAKNYRASGLPHVALQRCDGAKKERQVANVHRLHQSQQGLPKGQLLAASDQQNSR